MNGTLIKAIDSVGDPPLPIPNREVKPDSADGTANVCGRVGHRHFYRREFQEIGTLFFVFLSSFGILVVQVLGSLIRINDFFLICLLVVIKLKLIKTFNLSYYE